VTRATRRQLLARAGALGVLGGGLLDAGTAAAASPRRPPDEGRVLSGLVEVELLLVYSYRAALASGQLSAEPRRLAAQILGYEREHARALAARLAALAAPVPAPPRDAAVARAQLARHHSRIDFARRRDERGWLGLLLDVEDVAERGYHSALGELRTRALLSLCAEIYAGEGQHAVLLGMLLHPGKPKQAVSPFVNGNANGAGSGGRSG
jgi:hypothetical protein